MHVKFHGGEGLVALLRGVTQGPRIFHHVALVSPRLESFESSANSQEIKEDRDTKAPAGRCMAVAPSLPPTLHCLNLHSLS